MTLIAKDVNFPVQSRLPELMCTKLGPIYKKNAKIFLNLSQVSIQSMT